MKWIWRILIAIVAIILIAFGFLYYKGNSTKPIYNGELGLAGLESEVNVYYDEVGVPHIEAKTRADLYIAFGYVHAQDRLFQMELLRRAGSGTLAEVIGEPMVKVDRIFHTIGLPEYARASAAYMNSQKDTQMYQDLTNYIAGINKFVDSGNLPPEFSIIGIPPHAFTVEDVFYITGAMSFSFSQAQKTEPVVNHIKSLYGNEYLSDIALWHQSGDNAIPVFDTRAASSADTSSVKALSMIGDELENIFELLPFSPLEGSNSWVVNGTRTKSKEVIFCNDTHIGYLIPQTWYEAYLKCPDFELYGHFMAAVPFALVGRNSQQSWGLTMLLNDDMDFFQEKIEGDQVLSKGSWVPLKKKTISIKVKDGEDVNFEIPITPHGPVINGAFDGMSEKDSPISMSWTYTMFENKTMDGFYEMNNATDMKKFEAALSKIHAPGLSVNYGDAEGNIAWWACAQLVKRAHHVNSWSLLDGGSGNDDWQGYYTFSENPRNINPPSGFIYSANNWPEMKDYPTKNQLDTSYMWYPGYYKPEYRGERISKLLSETSDFTLESMKSVMTDITSDADKKVMDEFFNIVDDSLDLNNHSEYAQYLELFEWDGAYTSESYGSTFFTKMLYHYLSYACADEFGEANFKLFLSTHQVQRAQSKLITIEDSPWWDDVNTKDKKETRKDIIVKAYQQSITELQDQFGDNPKIWNWRKACFLELKHPLGEVAALRPIFNVGPHPVEGSNETIMQSGFLLNPDGEYKVYFGSQMRIIVDFAHADSALNITPCGQSGHLFSKHYSDQNEMYRNKEFRTQRMGIFPEEAKDHLVLYPIYPN